MDKEAIEADIWKDKSPMTALETIPMRMNKIKLGKNSRLNVTDTEIEVLMSSIKATGLLQPIGVAWTKSGYEVVFGNRRFLACSKLGWTKIPAIIYENQTETDIDLKNLTENIQRRNISLNEIGRYLDLLEEDGLTQAEMAVRLGMPRSFINSCMTAYHKVPKNFRNAIDTTGSRNTPAGKLSFRVSLGAVNASKTAGLTTVQTEKLFKHVMAADNAGKINLTKAAVAIKNSRDPRKTTSGFTQMSVRFLISTETEAKLRKKWIVDGAYKTLNSVFVDIIRGKIVQPVKTVGR